MARYGEETLQAEEIVGLLRPADTTSPPQCIPAPRSTPKEHSDGRNSFENFCIFDTLEDAVDTNIDVLVIWLRVSVGIDGRLKDLLLVLLLACFRHNSMH